MSQVPRRSVRMGLVYPLACLAFLGGIGGILLWQSQEQPGEVEPSDLPISYFEGLQREGEAAIPELLEWLESSDVAERRGAALTLFRLRPTSLAAREALLRHLEDPDVQVRQHSLATLYRVGIHLPRLVREAADLLGDHSDETRRWAKDLLLSAGRDAAPYMIPLLSHPHTETRLLAGKIFQEVGGWHPDFDPVLEQIVRDQAPGDSRFPRWEPGNEGLEATSEARALAVDFSHGRLVTLDQIPGPQFDSVAMGKLVAPYLGHEKSDVRRSATRLLKTFGPGGRGAVIRQLDVPGDAPKRHALHLLGGYRLFDQTLLQRLRAILRDDRTSMDVRFDALALIIASGEAASDEMRLALQPQSPVCSGVLELFSCVPERSLEFTEELLALLDDEKQTFTMPVLQTLGRLESLPEKAAIRIRAMLPAGQPWARLAAAYALRHSVFDRPEVESTVADIVVSGDFYMPSSVKALLDLAPDAVPMTVERLRPQLRDGPAARRRQAFLAITVLGPAACAALPEIQQALDSEDRELQGFAVLAIAGMGPGASSCIPRLVQLLTDLGEYTLGGPSVEAALVTMFDAYMVDAVTASTPETSNAVRQLVKYVDEEPGSDARFLRILAAIEQNGLAGKEALPAVLRSLDHLESQPEPAPFGYSRRWRKRRCALLQTLARIAPADHEVTIRLHRLLTDRFSEARFWSASLLLDRDGPRDECLQVLADLVSGSSQIPPGYLPLDFHGESIPKLAALRLTQLGRHAVSAMEALAEGVRQHSNDPLRSVSLQALEVIIADIHESGAIPPVEGLIPALQESLHRFDRSGKFAAVRTLAMLGHSAESCVSDLSHAASSWQNDIPEFDRRIWLTRPADDECLGVMTALPGGPTLREEIFRALEHIQVEK